MSLKEPGSFVKVTRYSSGDTQLTFKECRLMKPKDQKKYRGLRGTITELTWQSRKRCKTTLRAMSQHFKTFITLTYPVEMLGVLDGPQVKEHLHRFIKWMAYNHGKDLVYAWVLEFQRNGNPHFHLLIDRVIPKDDVALSWHKIVGSGLEKHLQAGTRVEAIRSPIAMADYVAQYLEKLNQKTVPENFRNVGRFWGYKRGAAQPVEEYTLSYSTPEDAKRDTRQIRRARRASLRRFMNRKEVPIKWRWRGLGFTDRSIPPNVMTVLLGQMKGEFVESRPTKEVPF